MLARTDGSSERASEDSFSLFFVEKSDGYAPGRQLDKIGIRASDTAELFFENVRVPAENLIGEPGQGLTYIKQHLPQARLAIAAASAVISRTTLNATLEYVKERKVFGSRVADFQNTRFASEKACTITDRCLQLFGGYGYINEHPVAQAFLAARLLPIFGGTNELLRDNIGFDLLAE